MQKPSYIFDVHSKSLNQSHHLVENLMSLQQALVINPISAFLKPRTQTSAHSVVWVSLIANLLIPIKGVSPFLQGHKLYLKSSSLRFQASHFSHAKSSSPKRLNYFSFLLLDRRKPFKKVITIFNDEPFIKMIKVVRCTSFKKVSTLQCNLLGLSVIVEVEPLL